MRKLCIAVILFALPAAAAFAGSADATRTQQVYKMHFELAVGGQTLGHPTIISRANKQASVTVRSAATHDGYRLVVTAGPAHDASKADAIRVAMQIFESRAGDWVRVGEPTLWVLPGKPGTLRVEQKAGEAAASLYVKLTATPISRQELEKITS